MGKSSGSGQTGTSQIDTSGISEPWQPQQKYLTTGFEQALNALQQGGPSPFPNQTFVPFSPQSEQAMGMMEQRALAGSPLNEAAQNLTQQTLEGQFLTPDSNPFLEQYYQRGAEQIQPNIAAMFGAGGRTGSGAQAMALGRGLADLSTGIYGGAYDQERKRQMDATRLAPMLAQQDYMDINQLMGVGRMAEAKGMEQIQDQMQRYYANQMRTENALDRYLARVRGNYGGVQTGQQMQPVYGPTTGQNIMGGAMLGAALGGTNPIPYALGGGLLGGIFG